MSLTDEEISHVAMLARLGLSEEERKRYGAQLGAILEHISRLDEVDTSSVTETAQVGELANVWREDEAGASLDVAAALANAPDREGPYFRVGAIQ
jgi:aspartyl-tRNA(Asn)/glutamyl-tRNA(Gln) amidotransferase subunit C